MRLNLEDTMLNVCALSGRGLFHVQPDTCNAGFSIHLTGSATAVVQGRVKAANHECSIPLPSWSISIPERSLNLQYLYL